MQLVKSMEHSVFMHCLQELTFIELWSSVYVDHLLMFLIFFPKMGREIQLGFYQNVSHFIFRCQTEADYKN